AAARASGESARKIAHEPSTYGVPPCQTADMTACSALPRDCLNCASTSSASALNEPAPAARRSVNEGTTARVRIRACMRSPFSQHLRTTPSRGSRKRLLHLHAAPGRATFRTLRSHAAPLALLSLLLLAPPAPAQPAPVRELTWGCDPEGGAPYVE